MVGPWALTGSPSISQHPEGLLEYLFEGLGNGGIWVQRIHVLVRGVAVWLRQVCTTCNCPVDLAKLPRPPVSAKGPPTLRRSMLEKLS